MENTKLIIKGIKEKNHKTFEYLYSNYFKLLKHIIFDITKNASLSEDLTQDVFFKMYEKIDTCNSNYNFKYWIITMAKNHAIDYLRKNSKVINNEEIVNNFIDSKELKIYEDIKEIINKNLTKEEYDIFILHFYHHLKFKEIAVIKETTTSNITSRYSKALKKIRNLNLKKEDFYE